MEGQYKYAANMAELYNRLEDDLSKDIFWARLQYDCEASLKHETRLFELTGMATEEELQLRRQMKQVSDKAVAEGKKLFLYGAGPVGRKVGEWLLKEGGDFYGYCARNHEKYVGGVNGKEVYPPAYVFEHRDECHVLIAVNMWAEEILNILLENNFPSEQISFFVKPTTFSSLMSRQYFEFPELFPKGKAFVDAGCFDCAVSLQFSDWCSGNYSKIFAVEPDPKNCQQCRATADSSSLRLELIPFGLSDRSGDAILSMNGTMGSHICTGNEERQSTLNYGINQVADQKINIKTVALDDIVNGTDIGFIKMDIEGEELNALHGAEKTILKDKPLLAICVYHRCGDVLAIMDYLHKLVPQYHFWLRQYSAFAFETVLYASVRKPQG